MRILTFARQFRGADLQDLHVGTRLANASVGRPYSAGRLAQPHKAVARLPVTLRIGRGPNLMTASGQILVAVDIRYRLGDRYLECIL
jgi:hypothetical protein